MKRIEGDLVACRRWFAAAGIEWRTTHWREGGTGLCAWRAPDDLAGYNLTREAAELLRHMGAFHADSCMVAEFIGPAAYARRGA